MAEYDLPDGPAELFEAVRATIGKYLRGEDQMRLGGGTALATRWAHRRSTDVDLFTDESSYRRLFIAEDRFILDLHLHTGGVEEATVEDGVARIGLAGRGQITLTTTRPLTSQPRSDDTVRGTVVPLETTAEILAKKLGYRMFLNHHIVPRDLYDIAIAREHHPEALQTALSVLRDRHLRDIDTELAHLRRGWALRHPEPLLDPVSQDAAENAIPIVRQVLQRELRSRTRAERPGVTPPGEH